MNPLLSRILTRSLLIVGLVVAQQTAQAVPTFARQTGMACVACHSQAFPALNTFGASFKASGYNLVGAQGTVKGDDLSLPAILNASLVTKFRYQKTGGSNKAIATNAGELQIPDEAALLLGGRVGKDIGYLAEIALFDTADTESGDFNLLKSVKVVYTQKVGDTTVSAIPFMTDAGGAGYGFELLNTGAYRFQRVGEDRSALMAQQYLGLGSGAATGVAFVASNPMGFVNLTAWSPTYGNRSPKGLATYMRAAYTPKIGDWDTAVGVQAFAGGSKDSVDGETVATKTRGFAIDAQAQGKVGNMPLNIYAAYGKTPHGTAENPNHFNTTAYDKSAFSVHAQLAFTPKLMALLGFRTADTGKPGANKDNAVTLGATYMLAQNMQVQLNHVVRSGSKFDADPKGGTGKSQTTLMLFSAF